MPKWLLRTSKKMKGKLQLPVVLPRLNYGCGKMKSNHSGAANKAWRSDFVTAGMAYGIVVDARGNFLLLLRSYWFPDHIAQSPKIRSHIPARI